jgi:hypothetical protein
VTEVQGSSNFQKFCNAFSRPPFRGTFATISGMTWSRGTVFVGTDYGMFMNMFVMIFINDISRQEIDERNGVPRNCGNVGACGHC